METGDEPLLAEKVYVDDETSDDAGSDLSDEDHSDFTPLPADRGLLDETEQQESLLAKTSRLDGLRNVFKKKRSQESARRVRTRGRQLRQQAEGSGNAQLIYEMEGGYKDTSSRSSSESLNLKDEKHNSSTITRSYPRIFFISVIILVLFILLLFGSYKASRSHTSPMRLSNGTHLFGPTTILISLDGFRADFLQRDLTPTMKALVESGVSPNYMLASFPTLTFPNHFTLVTGLYPESHGIVGNQFWDPHLQEEFNIGNGMQPKWWNAEPLWLTAQKQGLKTAIHMWPGSEAHILNMDPTYVDKFNATEALDVKVNRILSWLDLPEKDRPQFIGAYVPNVDSDGHAFGPNSTETRATIVEVDQMLNQLLEGLYGRNLTEVVNIVVVSDHGMATTSNDRLIQLDDLIDLGLVDHLDGWPLRGLRLKEPERDVPILYQQLLEASENAAFNVYTMDTMPERYHFTNNDRIAPLWVVPEPGWVVIERTEFDIEQARISGERYVPVGLHGYDYEHPLMRAIFIARGPAFPHLPHSRPAPFQNIEVYNIVCDSLGIQPHANNGTLRLPFSPGKLSGEVESGKAGLGDIADAVENSFHTSSAASQTATFSGTTSTDAAAPVTTIDQGSDADEPQSGTDKTSWWDFLHNQIQKAKSWAKGMIESLKHEHADGQSTTATT